MNKDTKCLAQWRPTNWIHLSLFAVREMKHSSLWPLALYTSSSPQPCSSLPPTYGTNTTLSHNGRDYHDKCNNGDAWDDTVCGTGRAEVSSRLLGVNKTYKHEWFLQGAPALKMDTTSACCCFLRPSLKTWWWKWHVLIMIPLRMRFKAPDW